jgi:hypothetical protein
VRKTGEENEKRVGSYENEKTMEKSTKQIEQ